MTSSSPTNSYPGRKSTSLFGEGCKKEKQDILGLRKGVLSEGDPASPSFKKFGTVNWFRFWKPFEGLLLTVLMIHIKLLFTWSRTCLLNSYINLVVFLSISPPGVSTRQHHRPERACPLWLLPRLCSPVWWPHSPRLRHLQADLSLSPPWDVITPVNVRISEPVENFH